MEIIPTHKAKRGIVLDGKSFCLTGSMSRPRKTIEKVVVDNGGKIKSVGKSLDYLVAGDNAGSKLKKAKGLRIKIITEEELLEMML